MFSADRVAVSKKIVGEKGAVEKNQRKNWVHLISLKVSNGTFY